jgi:uncharacterized repeat protein (TIGR02543 family)
MKRNNKNPISIDRIISVFMLITLVFYTSGRLSASNPGVAEPNSITLTINNVRTSSFSANWSAVPSATSYKIWADLFQYESYWYVPLSQYNGKVLSAGTTNIDITNVSAPYPYSSKCRFTVIAYNGTTKIDESSKEFYLLLDAPENESISNITSSSFTINWTQHAGSQYDTRITVSKKNGAIWESVSGFPKTINKPADVYTVTGLQGGTEYKVSLQFYIDNWFDGNIGWSYWTEDMVLTKPGAPVAIAATSITANSFTANWNASIGATGYKFYMKEKVSGKQVYNGNSTPFSQFLTSGLESGMQYEYQVSAVNETGESAKSNSISATTMILQSPVAISANSITTSSFNARWNAVADATGYLLSVSDGNVWTDFDVAGTSKNVTGLQSNKSYQYKVKAKFGTSISAYSNVIDVATKPTAPVATTATNISATSFNANWNVVSGATGYKLWVISNVGTGSNPVGYFPKSIGNVTTYNVTGLTSGHSYSYYVQVVTTNGESVVSNSIEVNTKPTTPTALDATLIKTTSFVANWQTVASASSYKLYVWKKQGGTYVSGYNGKTVTSTSETISNLLPETEYQYRLKAIKNSVESDLSNTIDASTGILPAPTATTATNISSTGFTANWSAVNGATGYLIWAWEKVGGAFIIGSPSNGFALSNGPMTFGGLKSNTEYQYRLKSTNGSIVSGEFSGTIDVKTALPASVQYTVTSSASPVDGGTTSIPSGTFDSGQSVTITAIPTAGYTFTNWTENGSQVSNSAVYTFSITANRILVAHFAQQAQDVTLTSIAIPAEGGSTSIPSGSYTSGQLVTITATSESGYNFVNWTENGTVVSTLASYTFSITADRNLEANFTSQAINYTVTSSVFPESGGTTSIPAGTYPSGQLVAITAIPEAGYIFVNWTENGIEVSTIDSYTFTINSNRELVANFAQQGQNYTVTSSALPLVGGSTSIPSGTYSSGQSVTITATPASGYNFVNWTEKGTQVSASASLTFIISANRTLVANFIQQNEKFTLTSSTLPLAGGTTSIPSGTYMSGQEVTIRATPAAGYTFVNWTNNGTVVSTLGRYKFTITENLTLVANFTQVVQNFTMTSSTLPVEGGTTDIPSGTYTSGQVVTIIATPAEGYNFVNWTESGMEVSTFPSYTFTVSSNNNLVANFTRQSKNFTVTSSSLPFDGGTTDIPMGTYASDQDISITATPTVGYCFVNWTENGEEISDSVRYTFTITTNRNLIANFVQQVKNYSITSSAFPSVGGTTSIPSGTYSSGELITNTATPSEGYNFVNWTENGEEVSTSAEYTFNVFASRILVANFSKKSFTILAEALPVIGGSTNISSGSYFYNEDVTLLATPADGYVFSNWAEEGIVKASTPYYIFNVTSNRHLVANFSVKTYSVTAEAKPAEGGTANVDLDSYEHEDTSLVTAISREGYEFVNWTVNGVEVSTFDKYSFQVSEDVHLTANFKSKKYSLAISSNNPEWGYTNFASDSFNYGETATISAMPNWGFQFINWTENGVEVTKDAYFSFKVLGGHILIANFQNNNGINDRVKPALNIYPNPATDFITISGIEKGTVVELVTLSGNIVNSFVAESNNFRIDIRMLRKGFYFVVIDTNSGKIARRIVIE